MGTHLPSTATHTHTHTHTRTHTHTHKPLLLLGHTSPPLLDTHTHTHIPPSSPLPPHRSLSLSCALPDARTHSIVTRSNSKRPRSCLWISICGGSSSNLASISSKIAFKTFRYHIDGSCRSDSSFRLQMHMNHNCHSVYRLRHFTCLKTESHVR